MDRLVWQTTKAQLYLTERAHVKRIVGRDRIQRNKVALRELRCLQEILSDLHSSTRSVSPSRLSAIEAAASSWHELRELSAARGVAPEDLCDVPPVVRQFFQAGYASAAAQRTLCGSETAATSTRAPSTALELDEVRSMGTEYHSEHVTHGDGLVTCPSSRMAGEQLDHLATELQEQLDQEHTSLLASIEEVQGLMEAEVAAPCTLPPLRDLSSFVADVEQIRGSRGEAHAAGAADAADAPGRSLRRAEEPRPRWADLSDSDKDGTVDGPRGCRPPPAASSRRATPPQPAEVHSAKESCEAARAPCQECGELLVRLSFSRRAWKRARSVAVMGDCEDRSEAETGKCLACAKN